MAFIYLLLFFFIIIFVSFTTPANGSVRGPAVNSKKKINKNNHE